MGDNRKPENQEPVHHLNHYEENLSICSFNDLSTLQIETAVVADKVLHDDDIKPTTLCGKIKDFFRILPRGATPPNWKVIGCVWSSMIASAFSITFLFPFLPEMVVDFGYSEEEKGYYVGLVASSMFAGRAFGSYFWGWMCDKVGRKPVFIICTLGTGVSTLIFGFSTNLTFAIVLRFVTGLVNGTIVVAKVLLYEVSDSTNQALGMSSLAMAFGVGIVIGPAIGGNLANPVLKYPSTFGGSLFLKKYPYFLCGILPFVIAICTSIVIFFHLPETKGRDMTRKPTADCKDTVESKGLLKGEKLDNAKADVVPSTELNVETCERRNMRRLTLTDTDEFEMRARMSSLSLYQSNMSIRKSHVTPTASSEPEEKKNGCCQLKIITLFKDPTVLLVVIIYTLLSFGIIGYDDLFTIWASTPHTLGGLGFSSSQIGIAVGVMAIPMMVLQLFIFPKIEARFGCKKTFQFCAIIILVLVQGIVMLRLLHNRPIPLWIGLFLFMVPLRILCICCMSSSSVMINNSVPAELAGAVNGLAMTSTAAARAMAPTAAGSLFAWSITDGEALGPPFDVSFSFFMLGLTFVVCIILNQLLPSSLDIQALKHTPKPDTKEKEQTTKCSDDTPKNGAVAQRIKET